MLAQVQVWFQNRRQRERIMCRENDGLADGTDYSAGLSADRASLLQESIHLAQQLSSKVDCLLARAQPLNRESRALRATVVLSKPRQAVGPVVSCPKANEAPRGQLG